jgi:uncharacterized RDD family membrane protein YckC
VSVPDDVITGEAVRLDVWPASFITRALALSLDLFVQGVAGIILVVILDRAMTTSDTATNAAVGLSVLLTVLIIIPVIIETFSRGRSLGKMAAGLRVVRDDGGPIRARHAIIRGLLSFLEIYGTLGSVAMIASLTNPRGKRLGDLLAGTYVIRERAPRPVPSGVLMPPHLAQWAAGADLGRIPDPLALAARQYLTRSSPLSIPARQRLSHELATQIAPLVAPQAPPGTPADYFLMAVLAERSRREYGRLNYEAYLRHHREEQRRRASLSAAGTGLINRS